MSFSAVLLAGGKSSRMGRDKAALPLPDGTLLWQHQIETLRATGADEIFLSGPRNGVYANSDLPILPDATSGLGPLSGLLSGLRTSRHEHLLLLAVDLPLMKPHYLRTLWGKCAPGIGAVAYTADNRYEPLAAFYPREILPSVQKQIAAGAGSFQPLLRDAVINGRMIPVPVEAPFRSLFYNLNGPDSILVSLASSER